MKNKYKISIIVPVYNTEKYIERCINSILNQEFKDFQLIIINDGSTDSSEKKILSLTNKLSNVIYKKIKNSGVAHARNYGLKYVEGEYVAFVDSDDFIDKTMLNKLYKTASKNKCDIVSCGYKKIYNDGIFKEVHPKDISCYGKSLVDSKNILLNTNPYITNKLFKYDMIRDNNISFDEDLRIFEDLLFCYKLFLLANKIYFIDECLYNYNCVNESSLTNKFTEKMFDVFTSLDRLIEFYRDKYGNQFDEVLEYTAVKHIMLRFNEKSKDKKMKLKYIDMAYSYLKKNFNNYKKCTYFVGKNGFIRKNKFIYKIYYLIKGK